MESTYTKHYEENEWNQIADAYDVEGRIDEVIRRDNGGVQTLQDRKGALSQLKYMQK